MGRTMSSREVIAKLKKLGWYLYAVEGDHYNFKHPELKGKVTVCHPVKTIGETLLKSIERQAQTRLK